jgi:DNA modification methylase
MACRYELREFIGIEREAEYLAIAERRIAAVAPLVRRNRMTRQGEKRQARTGAAA